MGQNPSNPNGPRRRAKPVAPRLVDASEVPATEAPIDDAMLFEATEAFIAAISRIESGTPEADAVAAAVSSEILAPFDAPVVRQAVDFLRRLGYLGIPDQPRRGGEPA